MSGQPDYAGLQRRYGKSGSEVIDELVEAGDAYAAALQTLRTNPTPDGAERIGAQLHGMQRSVAQLITALVREIS